MSVFPKIRQLQRAEGRQWRTTGSTTFDFEYQGRLARVEGLILPSLEDRIFLGWNTLRDLIRGPIYDNQFLTLTTKLRRDNLEPENLQNHANTIRLEGPPRRKQEYRDYKPNKPCPDPSL